MFEERLSPIICLEAVVKHDNKTYFSTDAFFLSPLLRTVRMIKATQPSNIPKTRCLNMKGDALVKRDSNQ